MLYNVHTSTTIQRIIATFSEVVSLCKISANLYISAHLHIGNDCDQLQHTTVPHTIHVDGKTVHQRLLFDLTNIYVGNVLFCVMNISSSR